ncbi:nucleoside phosphatase family-domain-containing protein [Collybia nuda]|uniref:Nucleoside phosphatase family-domain-containing protein n=1 Tax=Collybia nuda TaxID=64659 RepID=A0A9P5XZ24_9AGAR|nr:nucleoside phosphatase family-domain-containing protein [Collybia nuda]
MPRQPREMCYAAILDAGSSGTRVYVFGWKKWIEGDPSPPQIEELLNVKEDGGIAKLIPTTEITTLAPREQGDIEEAIEDRVEKYLNSLFNHGRAFCAGAGIASTSVPLYLLATAGMRELRGTHGRLNFYNALLACIKRFTATEKSGFDAKECGAITGEAEALYGWVAANYSLGAFSGFGMRASQTVGYVELGGASAQIAYNLVMDNATSVAKASAVADKVAEQDVSQRAQDIKAARATLASGDSSGGLNNYAGRLVKVKIGALEFDMFLGSYRLGADVAREEFIKHLIAQTNGNNKGCEEKIGDKTFVGTADYTVTKDVVKGIVDDDEVLDADKLYNPPTNEIPNENVIKSPNRSFVGGSSFWYNTRGVFGLDRNGKPKTSPFSFEEYEQEIQLNFKLAWPFAQTRRAGVKPKFIKGSGFTAAWIQHILFECFKFKRGDTTVTHEDKLTFRPYNGSEGAELSWTLGKIVLHSVNGELKQMSGPRARELNTLQAQLRVEEAALLKLEDSMHDKQHLFRSLLKGALKVGAENYMEEQEKAGTEIDEAVEIRRQVGVATAGIATLKTNINTLKGTIDTELTNLGATQKFFVPLNL